MKESEADYEMKKRVKLKNCPAGLFEFDGDLFLKTEYCSERIVEGTVHLKSIAYCVESGETFCGGVDSFVKRENLLVRPIDYDEVKERLLRKGNWKDGTVHDGVYEREGVVCSVCGEERDYETEAIEALEKQIPQKVIRRKCGDCPIDGCGTRCGYYTNRCPACKESVENEYDTEDKYCRNCGQALEWSE